jgi:uncharacterized protein
MSAASRFGLRSPVSGGEHHHADRRLSAALGRYIFEGWEYYCTDRAYHPRSAKSFTWSSVDRIAYFDGFRFIALIAPRPVLMIVGREAATSCMTTEAFWNAQEPKELFWVDGATHNDLYDVEQYVTPAIAKLTEFFRTRLAGTTWDPARMTVA